MRGRIEWYVEYLAGAMFRRKRRQWWGWSVHRTREGALREAQLQRRSRQATWEWRIVKVRIEGVERVPRGG